MYVTINNIIGSKRINLSYPIYSINQRKEIAVVIMLSDNVQYWLRRYIKIQLKSSKEIMLNKGVYTDKELNSLIRTELKSQMISSRDDGLRTNKLDNVTKMTISLNTLDNSDNLEDG